MNAHTNPEDTLKAIINPAALADELGLLKAQIAKLELRESEIKQALIEVGQISYAGNLFDVTVGKEQTRETVNRKALEADLGPLPENYVTTSKPFRNVTVTAKK